MTYPQWNEKLVNAIFSDGCAGKQVSLCLSKTEIESIGEADGADFADFVRAIEAGVRGGREKPAELCARPLDALRGWDKTSLPPFVAYLVFFIYAAGLDGDFASNDYYRRLRSLVSASTKVRNGFESDLINWMCESLEKWANVEKRGELGTFRYFVYGSHRHVGPLLAQTVLSQQDREVLPWVWEQSGFDPASPPHEGELLSAFQQARPHLRARTQKILDADSKDIARQMLADLLLAELLDWDGRVEARFDGQTRSASLASSERESAGSLRLCASYNSVSGRLKAQLRCKTPIEFPDDGFRLHAKTHLSEIEWVAQEWDDSWSCPLQNRATGAELDAATLPWKRGWTLHDTARSWKFRWRASDVRLLSRDPEGILGEWVEVFRLPMGREVWVLAAAELEKSVEAWGQKCAHGWTRIAAQGLPDGWILWECQAITEAALSIKTLPHPILAVSSRANLLFRGGVRVNRATRFFDFALPRVEIEGPPDAILAWRELGGQSWNPLVRDADGLFTLPPDASSNRALRLSARLRADETSDDEEIAAQTLYVETSSGHWRAVAISTDPQSHAEIPTPISTLALGGLVSIEADGALIYLGQSPGQIARFPCKPQGWEPVWILNGGRRRRAIYCGSDLAREKPLDTTGKAARNDSKEWKRELSAQVEPPAHKAEKALWAQYLHCAKNLRP